MMRWQKHANAVWHWVRVRIRVVGFYPQRRRQANML
jgi:hypothetical protein